MDLLTWTALICLTGYSIQTSDEKVNVGAESDQNFLPELLTNTFESVLSSMTMKMYQPKAEEPVKDDERLQNLFRQDLAIQRIHELLDMEMMKIGK